MKYISFLGNLNYDDITYPNDGGLVVKYIQNVILNKHRNEMIDGLYVVTTEEGYKNHYEVMCNAIYATFPKLPVKEIIVKDESDYEDVIKIILNEVKEDLDNQDVILDVTHCYRSMPTKILLTLDYLEKRINIKVKNLYYGKIDTTTKIGELIDFIKFYEESKVSESLRQFKETLKLTHRETIFEKNSDLNKMLEEMQSLNDYLELADYQNTKKCMLKILNYSKRLKDSTDMKRIKIYLESIYYTFKKFEEVKNDLDSLKVIVDILCEYRYNQLACTFIYKMYEKWLEDNLYVKAMDSNRFKVWQTKIRNELIKSRVSSNEVNLEGLEYDSKLLNQIIDFCHNNQAYKTYNFNGRLSEDDKFYLLPYLIYESYVYISDFASKVRNPLNHANTLRTTNVRKEFDLMMNCIKRLYKVVDKYDL